MFVMCAQCKYDSGDFDDPEQLKAKVLADGGRWQDDGDALTIACPDCQGTHGVHLD